MGVTDVRFAKSEGKESEVTKHKCGMKLILNGISLTPSIVWAKESQLSIASVLNAYIQFTLKVSCSNSTFVYLGPIWSTSSQLTPLIKKQV